MTIVWSATAERDLEDIAAYYTEHAGPDVAARVVRRLTASIVPYTRFPAWARPGEVPGTREIVLRGWPYIVYTVHDEVFEVVSVLHTSRARRR